MAAAEFELHVEPDGTVSWKTGRIPDMHHDMADEFQKELEAALGGEVEREEHFAKPRHVHHEGHTHTHEHNHPTE